MLKHRAVTRGASQRRFSSLTLACSYVIDVDQALQARPPHWAQGHEIKQQFPPPGASHQGRQSRLGCQEQPDKRLRRCCLQGTGAQASAAQATGVGKPSPGAELANAARKVRGSLPGERQWEGTPGGGTAWAMVQGCVVEPLTVHCGYSTRWDDSER